MGRKLCSAPGCTKHVQQGGVCCKHGAKQVRKTCSEPGCKNYAIKGGVCCKHGAKQVRKTCSEPGCTTFAIKGGVCCKHGSQKKRCSVSGCAKGAIKDGVCVKHGAVVKRCSAPGCTNGTVKGGVCFKHGADVSQCRGGADGTCHFGRYAVIKYDYRCVRCFCDAFPNDPRADKAKKYRHAKELTVRAFLESTFTDYRWVFDRTAAVGTRVRPDAKTAFGRDRVLIVEIDEDSHSHYVCGDERERERLFRAHAPRDAVVHLIRFNPDAYDDPLTGARVPSCFRYSKVEAVVSVHPDRRADWERRLETLRATIQEIFNHRHAAVEVPPCVAEEDDRYASVVPIELFYDDVRAKYGVSGNQQKLAALKRASQSESSSSTCLPCAPAQRAQRSDWDSSDSEDDE